MFNIACHLWLLSSQHCLETLYGLYMIKMLLSKIVRTFYTTPERNYYFSIFRYFGNTWICKNLFFSKSTMAWIFVGLKVSDFSKSYLMTIIWSLNFLEFRNFLKTVLISWTSLEPYCIEKHIRNWNWEL